MISLVQAINTTRALVDTTSNMAPETSLPTVQALRLVDLLIKGGWIMIPIGLLAVIGLVIFWERYFSIRQATNNGHLMAQVKSTLSAGTVDAAIAICSSSQSPLSIMLQKGLMCIGRPIKDMEGAMENVGKLEIAKLEKNIPILGIIAGIAPMFGFLGTIVGVIKVFYNISLSDNISMGIIAGGLYEKMITSATGLLVGILAYVAYHLLHMMVDKVLLKLETDAVAFIDFVEAHKK